MLNQAPGVHYLNEIGQKYANDNRNTSIKKCIWIVDDQVPVLESAVLILRTVDPQWEVTGFSDAFKALEAIQSKAPDLILSDEVMPGMLGSQLLEQVRILSPSTIRIIMSGCVSLSRLALITSAHQYLAKPFDVIELRQTIRRTLAAQERVPDKGLHAIVTSLRSIPSAPKVHHALLSQLKDSHSATTNIARLVAEDAGLSVKVLQLANSPLFGPGYLIQSPFDAAMCLGIELIATVASSQALFRHCESLAAGEFQVRQVWDHCWRTAFFAQHICREMKFSRVTGEEAFLAGLLHEIGRFILADNFPDRYQAACQCDRKMESSLAPRLREEFHAGPGQIAAYVLELWGMPAGVVGAIAAQDNLSAPQDKGSTLASALYIADGIASRQSPPDAFAPQEWNTAYLNAIGCLDKIPIWERLSLEPKTAASL